MQGQFLPFNGLIHPCNPPFAHHTPDLSICPSLLPPTTHLSIHSPPHTANYSVLPSSHPSVHLVINPPTYSLIHLYIHPIYPYPYGSPTTQLSVHLSIALSFIHLLFTLPISSSIYLPTHPSTHSPSYPSIHLYPHLSILYLST